MPSQFAAYGCIILEAGCIARFLLLRIAKQYPAFLSLVAVDLIRTALLLWIAELDYHSRVYATVWAWGLPLFWMSAVAATYEVFAKIGRQQLMNASVLMRWAALPGALLPLLWFMIWGDYTGQMRAMIASFRFANRCVLAACVATLIIQVVFLRILNRKPSHNLGYHRAILVVFLGGMLTASLLSSATGEWLRDVGKVISVIALYICCFAWMFSLRFAGDAVLHATKLSTAEVGRRERELHASRDTFTRSYFVTATRRHRPRHQSAVGTSE